MRPKKTRWVKCDPSERCFQPQLKSRLRSCCEITLSLDEFEAVRLLDYEGLMQEEAADRMNISRPTLTRIYENARKTIAQAFVEGKMILIDGGNVQFGKQWFRCKRCFKLIGGLENHVRCRNCKTFCIDELTPIK